jgi:RNA polymerase sigma-70 factor (ECF subfamily)
MTVDAGMSNEALVERMAEQDQEALSLLYDRHRTIVYALALRILRDAAEAEEVLSDVFFQAWRGAGGFDPLRGSVTAWLVTLCRSRAIDRLRKRGRRDAALEEQARQAPAAPSRADAAAADWRMHRTRILSALGSLAPEQRSALELVYFDGLSHTEIAAKLREPLGTIKTRIRQGLLHLRERLGGPPS